MLEPTSNDLLEKPYCDIRCSQIQYNINSKTKDWPDKVKLLRFTNLGLEAFKG